MREVIIREPTIEERGGCQNGVSECHPIGDATPALVVVDGRVMCTAHATWHVGSVISGIGLHAALAFRRAQSEDREGTPPVREGDSVMDAGEAG
jgi:hypothetical protein